MAGYVASGRLQGAVPRFAGNGPGRRGTAVPPGFVTMTASLPVEADQVELVGRPLDASIRDWLASIGESWSQLTFYLFDSESWR